MKKLLILFLFMSLAFTMSAQTWMNFTCTLANDSLTGIQGPKYYVLSKPIFIKSAASLTLSLTPSVVNYGSDSTFAWWEGSSDNSTWYKIDMGLPTMTGAATYFTSNASTIASGHVYKMKTVGAGTWFFLPTNLSPPYLRLAIQHYVATKVMQKPTIAKVYLK